MLAGISALSRPVRSTALPLVPDWIDPMLATLTDERDLGDGWVLERKLDRIRCLAFVRRGRVTLLSRTRKPLNFPSVAGALQDLGRDMIIDGEVVAIDQRGNPLGFQALQRRRLDPGSLVLWAFDLPWHGCEDLRGGPCRSGAPSSSGSSRPEAPSRAARPLTAHRA